MRTAAFLFPRKTQVFFPLRALPSAKTSLPDRTCQEYSPNTEQVVALQPLCFEEKTSRILSDTSPATIRRPKGTIWSNSISLGVLGEADKGKPVGDR